MNDWIVSKVLSAEAQSPPQTETKSEGTTDVMLKPEIAVEPPITEYERLNSHPYIFEYLKLKDSGINKDVLYDVHYKPNLKEIDKFVIDEIGRNKLTPTIESYNQIMEKIKNYLSIGNNDLPDKIINIMKVYMKGIKEQRKLKDKYRRLLDHLKNIEGDEL
jgi:hypothetical protein